ncbi:hypothetical protein [Rhizobium rhizogenes]|nr:hypothetical protein [Rhizobium rhizogenes]MCZ7467301.1 hypothetical protein [Rhizobium rhizogenes]
MNGETWARFLLPSAEAAVTPRPVQTKRLARSAERQAYLQHVTRR